MIQKTPFILYCTLLFSSLVTAEEALPTDNTKKAEEAQAIIQQVEASEKNGDETAKTWIPSAEKFDWIQLTSNEWLKGEIKGMYKDSLEFDSDKLDLLTIDWEDVKILRSYRTNNINIEGIGATSGVLEVTGDSLEVVSDYENQTFDRTRLISFAPGGKKERDLWAIKATLSLDLRQGNTDQIDYTARVNVKRRASTTRFLMDYIGNISKTNGGDGSLVETINNHRLNASYDYYKTRYFFYTPVFAEYFRDPFTNIDSRITLGAGLGYTVIDDGKTELSFAGGPAFVKTEFVSVAAGENSSESTPAAVLRTNYDYELTKTIDFIARYNIQVGNKESGGYTHHIILTFESEITGALDFDTSFIWDRTSNPTQAEDGTTPAPDDYRVTFGISYTY
jgi:putative salt-induced outer membrane protein YdiY